MKREVTEADFRMPEYRDAKPEDYEFRQDGKLVRKDRWEVCVRDIADELQLDDWEIEEVVDTVRALVESKDGLTISHEDMFRLKVLFSIPAGEQWTVDRMINDVFDLDQDYVKASNRAGELESTLRSLEENLQNMTTERNECQASWNRLRDDRDFLIQKNEELLADLQKALKEVDGLRGRIDEAQETIERRDRRIKELVESNDDLARLCNEREAQVSQAANQARAETNSLWWKTMHGAAVALDMPTEWTGQRMTERIKEWKAQIFQDNNTIVELRAKLSRFQDKYGEGKDL